MMTRYFDVAEGFNKEDVVLPTRATKGSAGYDFSASEDVTIPVGQMRLVKTGVAARMQDDEVLELFVRSSLAYKKQVTLQNGVGILDHDFFPNPIGVLLRNEGEKPFVVNKGDRIAQGIFKKYLTTVNDHVESTRDGGFGSTGK